MKVSHSRYYDEDGHENEFEMECLHQKSQVLDGFSLQFNAIIYMLQKECGFRVRSFLLYDEEFKNKRIFLFLNLSIENRLKVAGRYKIRK